MDNQNYIFDESAGNQYQAPTSYEPQVAESGEEKSKGTIAIIIMLIIFLAVALVFLFMANKPKYAVVFIDGEEVEAFVVKEGSTVAEKKNSKANFNGWYYGSTKYDFETKIKENIVLKANYTKEEVKKYKVTFDSNGGSTVAAVTVNENDRVNAPAAPTKEGYNFVEWKLNGQSYDFNNPVTENITLTAEWQVVNPDEITYRVTFDSNGGSEVAAVTVKANEKVKAPTAPTKEGYKFDGWKLDNKSYDFNKAVTSNITLTAAWSAKTKITVTFDSDGGSKVENLEMYAGDKLPTLPTPTKASFVFGGWYSGSTKYVAGNTLSKNITLKAKWLSEDDAKIETAKSAIKSSYDITKGGQEIKPTSDGCTFELTNASQIATITRGTKDKKVTLNFNITCGNATGTATATGNIKASSYKYSAVESGNRINYIVTIYSGSKKISDNGELATTSGEYLGAIKSGEAYVNNSNVENSSKFIMALSGDSNTLYEVVKK